MHSPETAAAVTTMSPEEAAGVVGTGLASYHFVRDTSHAGKQLARDLSGGKAANPNVGPAMRTAEELERRLEAIAVVRNLPPTPEPTQPRPVPPEGDLPAMLSDASRDARYVARLTASGAAISMRRLPEALRIVRALRPKLEAIWTIYETMPTHERVVLAGEAQEAFWRKMDELATEAALGR